MIVFVLYYVLCLYLVMKICEKLADFKLKGNGGLVMNLHRLNGGVEKNVKVVVVSNIFRYERNLCQLGTN